MLQPRPAHGSSQVCFPSPVQAAWSEFASSTLRLLRRNRGNCNDVDRSVMPGGVAEHRVALNETRECSGQETPNFTERTWRAFPMGCGVAIERSPIPSMLRPYGDCEPQYLRLRSVVEYQAKPLTSLRIAAAYPVSPRQPAGTLANASRSVMHQEYHSLTLA
jgi:hypothetical protein